MNARIFVPNAIVFVLDPSNRCASVPDYVPNQVAVANSTCISVATRAEVDGEVSFCLEKSSSGAGESAHKRVFDGSIETPGGKLAIVTAQFERVLETDVTAPVSRVTISVDEMCAPSVVRVNVI